MLGLGLILGGLLAIGLARVWQQSDWPPPMEAAAAARALMLGWLTSIPLWVYILAFVVLPALGFPLSIFYFTVGAAVGNLWLALLVAWTCVAADVALGYWLAARGARPLIERIVRNRGFVIPKIKSRNQLKWIILLRISPIPFGMQSFILGLGQVPFGRYLFWSVFVQMIVGSGAVVFGQSVLSGNAGRALVALFILLATVMTISWWRRRQPPIEDELGA